SCPGSTLRTSSMTALRCTGSPYGPSSGMTLEEMSNIAVGANSASGAAIPQSTNPPSNETEGDEPRTVGKQGVYRMVLGTYSRTHEVQLIRQKTISLPTSARWRGLLFAKDRARSLASPITGNSSVARCDVRLIAGPRTRPFERRARRVARYPLA